MKKVNKEKFLKELEKKLKVLSQEEKQDILNEYEDIIAEKIESRKREVFLKIQKEHPELAEKFKERENVQVKF